MRVCIELNIPVRIDAAKTRTLHTGTFASAIRTLASSVETIGGAHELARKITARCARGKWRGIIDIDIDNAAIVDCGWLVWNMELTFTPRRSLLERRAFTSESRLPNGSAQ